MEKRSFDAEGSGSIPDLDYIHDTQFCTDVSAWSEVEWMGIPMQKCNTTFGKDRKTKREMVRWIHVPHWLHTLICVPLAVYLHTWYKAVVFLFQVCANITELKCDILPYTECELQWISQKKKTYKETRVPYNVKGCNETKTTIKHKKLVPHCVDETKLNCVTLWKTDDDGNQVIIKTFFST